LLGKISVAYTGGEFVFLEVGIRLNGDDKLFLIGLCKEGISVLSVAMADAAIWPDIGALVRAQGSEN